MEFSKKKEMEIANNNILKAESTNICTHNLSTTMMLDWRGTDFNNNINRSSNNCARKRGHPFHPTQRRCITEREKSKCTKRGQASAKNTSTVGTTIDQQAKHYPKNRQTWCQQRHVCGHLRQRQQSNQCKNNYPRNMQPRRNGGKSIMRRCKMSTRETKISKILSKKSAQTEE